MVVGCYQTKGRKNTRSLENSAQNCKADVSDPYREKLAGQQPEKKIISGYVYIKRTLR